MTSLSGAYPRATTVPCVTASQMGEVDRWMNAAYRIDLVRMMENAGRLLARLARDRFLGADAAGKEVEVLAGTGGNGGGAMVCARNLSNWGARVRVTLSAPSEALAPIPRRQLEILRRLEVPIAVGIPRAPCEATLVVDGILGYSIEGAPRGVAADIIGWANELGAPVLSIDVPSGLDATTGEALHPTVRAAATLTLALPKTGLLTPSAARYVGELYLADIGVPPRLYDLLELELPEANLFSSAEILRLA